MISYKSEITLLSMARPKDRRGSCLDTSLLRMSLRREKRIPFTPPPATDGKGRMGRKAGDNVTRMIIGLGCWEGDIRDARDDGAVYGKAAG